MNAVVSGKREERQRGPKGTALCLEGETLGAFPQLVLRVPLIPVRSWNS